VPLRLFFQAVGISPQMEKMHRKAVNWRSVRFLGMCIYLKMKVEDFTPSFLFKLNFARIFGAIFPVYLKSLGLG
jgi:hypothetical protein